MKVGSNCPKKNTYVKNGAVTVRASGREKVVVVGLTVGAGISFEEVSGSQFLQTVGACEMFRVPSFAWKWKAMKW